MGNITSSTVIARWSSKSAVRFDWTRLRDDFQKDPTNKDLAWIILAISCLPPMKDKVTDVLRDKLTHVFKSTVYSDYIDVPSVWDDVKYTARVPSGQELFPMRDLLKKYETVPNNRIEINISEWTPSLMSAIFDRANIALYNYRTASSFRTMFRLSLEKSISALRLGLQCAQWSDDIKAEADRLELGYQVATKDRTLKTISSHDKDENIKYILSIGQGDEKQTHDMTEPAYEVLIRILQEGANSDDSDDNSETSKDVKGSDNSKTQDKGPETRGKRRRLGKESQQKKVGLPSFIEIDDRIKAMEFI